MRPILALAMKDLRLLLRDKVGFFFIFFFPLGMAIFFGTVFSAQSDGEQQATKMRVLLVDEDQTPESQGLVALLSEEDALAVVPVEGREDALAQVREGAATALIVIPEGYGQASEQMFWGDPRTIQLGVDPARNAEGGMLQGIVTKSAFAQLQQQMADTDTMMASANEALALVDPEGDAPLAGMLTNLQDFLASVEQVQEEGGESANPMSQWNPLEIESLDVLEDGPDDEKPSLSPYSISFPQGAVWAILGAAAGFGISLVVEREKGTLVRLRTAPIHQRDILAGKALACFVTIVGVLAMLMLIGWAFFGVVPRAPLLLAVSIACSAAAFVGIMMLLSVLGKTEAAASGIGWGVLVIMAMLGGGMIPLFIMPGWMADVSMISPVRWAVYALEGAIWRPVSGAVMLQTYAVLLAIGAVCFTLGALVFRRMEG